MFPSQNNIDYTTYFEQDLVIEDFGFIDSSIQIVPKISKKRQRTSSKDSKENIEDEEAREPKAKKIMHRDIERQRRKEMNNLYTSLRSLLPLEFIKGKRSISDHMHEAVNYIKHMEKKLKQMKMRKDDLNKSASSSNYDSQNKISNSPLNPQNCVCVSPCLDGVEILIIIELKGEERHSLSRVFKLLIESGLDVINYVSTNSSGRFLYRIQCQDNGVGPINVPVLEESLSSVINSRRSRTV